MSTINTHITIPKNVASNNDLDYAWLKQKGLEYIEQLSGNLWTDYNSHDPGITILEMLCYAITDLGLRIEMPIENILAPENRSAKKIEEQFFKASDILPSKPVTGLDYRKLFIDLDGINNCWLKPYKKTVYVDCLNDRISYSPTQFADVSGDFKKEFTLKGLYSVVLDLSEEVKTTSDFDKIKEKVIKRFHANRNLCEDLIEVTKIETQPISVCYIIELYPEADEELVEAQVSLAIDNYFSPGVKFYSLKQLVEKGYTTDEIFDGPVLSHGFIDPEELKKSDQRTEVRLSDIMKLIMNIEGVKFIKDISIADRPKEEDEPDRWRICIDEGKKPVRCPNSGYSYYKGVLPVNINKTKVEEYKAAIIEKEQEEREKSSLNMEVEIPSGSYMNTSETTTIQNDFPDTYGIGLMGLPNQVETARKAKAKQLKGYLLFFDQVLASYFAHLGKVKDLLSVDNPLTKTYFTQAVADIRNFDELVEKYPVSDSDELTDLLFKNLDHSIERKNQILDHLMARFAEKFSDFAFLMKELYGDFADEAILQSKENFQKDYHITSMERGSAFNYYKQTPQQLWNTANVAGVEKRIARLSGMKNFNRRNLSESFAEIYDFTDIDGKKVYRWRIRNEQNEILLSATINYKTARQAELEMQQSVIRIIETPEEVVESAFDKTITDKTVIGNMVVQVSETNRYSFDVINPDITNTHREEWIIARCYEMFDTPEELKNAMLGIIGFMTGIYTEEGMFLIEHPLLLPDGSKTDIDLNQFMPISTDKCTSCEPIDPYSYRITVVLPGWTYRFANPDFRRFMEELIRKEIPAHILARICWIGYRKNEVEDDENQMLQLEKTWKNYLLDKTTSGQIQDGSKRTDLISILNELNSIYPKGRLINCNNEDDSLEGKIIIGRTYIGNL
ncbi:MAG TPA: hypothetical protein PKH79_07780 [Prolixibacteraceae bacterium]|nr:hypothetical protein [Prolixibacteraceae bacterium]